MVEVKIAPYGSWKSPITSELIVSETIGLGGATFDGDDIYWLEMRPAEGGRYVLMRRSREGEVAEVTPKEFNARSRVHEYGGGSFLVDRGSVYFANFSDRRLYRQSPNSPPSPITPESDWRYADATMDRARDRLICIREDHTKEGEPENTIVAVSLDGENSGGVLVSSCDFYAYPRVSPDGSHLSWTSWNHPNMPWDEVELWVGQIAEDGSIAEPQKVAGEGESIFDPQWSPDGVLYFVSDRTGWWNLYRWNGETVEPLFPLTAEFGKPQWGLGMSTYTFVDRDRLACTYNQNGIWNLAILDVRTKRLTPISTPYTEFSAIDAKDDTLLLCAASPTEPTAIVEWDLTSGDRQILRQSAQLSFDRAYLCVPQPIEFPTEGGKTAYAIFYPPQNPGYRAPDGEKPPLLVKSHGGPTAAASSRLSLGIQYWTSRGFAVVDVNYGGSTGYGREYRQRLKGQWGVIDIDDCANAAKYLAREGKVDGDRLAISGGSAGGYTTLGALTFRDTFKAGASYYGVSDLEALAKETHKFESRYLDGLIGPYPERQDLYQERSPIHHCDRLSCPVAFFQGLEDKIVPPNQAEAMVEALTAKGLPVAYVAFEGEQHGFRRAENIKRALDGEFYFYSRVFGYEPAEEIEPLNIENL